MRENPRYSVLAAAARVLRGAGAVAVETIRVQIFGENDEVQVVLQGEEPPPLADATGWLEFSPMEEAIVRALADSEQRPAKQIARLIGYAHSSTLDSILANLVERRVLSSGHGGYTLNRDPHHADDSTTLHG